MVAKPNAVGFGSQPNPRKKYYLGIVYIVFVL